MRRGLLVACAVSAALVFARDAANVPRLKKVDRYHLFGFDSYVYVAMAEDPAFFTVAPWGYRVLSPLLVRALAPREEVVKGFRRLSLAGLLLAGPLLYLFLRREGAREGAALAATGLFFFTPPVDEMYRNFFLAEPLGVPLLLVALLALGARGSGPGALAPAAVFAAALGLGALTKDVFVVFLPGFLAGATAIHGLRRGAVRALPGVGVAVAVHLGLRTFWAPHPGSPGPDPTLADFATALARIFAATGQWGPPFLACGVPLSVVGLLRPEGRRLFRRYGLLLLLALALPFAAGVYTGTEFPADHFYTDDVPRLLAYAMPVLLALALAAFGGRAAPLDAPDAPPSESPSRDFPAGSSLAAGVVVVAALALPFAWLDRYRREDLRGPADGPFVLAFSRDSLSFARRLEAGRTVMYEPTGRRYLPGRSDPRHMERMRWFLREGFGDRAAYGMEEAVASSFPAAVILPVLTPRDLTLGLELAADEATPVAVAVNGRPVGQVVAAPDPARQRLPVPAAALFRGDNRLTFVRPAGSAHPLRLRVLNVRASGGGAPPRP
jgi:hypothetical protein